MPVSPVRRLLGVVSLALVVAAPLPATAALCPIDAFIKSVQGGKVYGYQDALTCPR